ncbi:MAG: nucleoside triphosphate hydrolase [Pseudomonadota bacterium]
MAAHILGAHDGRSRTLVAIAGAPAAGKSTLSKALNNHLNATDGVSSAVVPMDGFHLDNSRLQELQLLARKGAPETFDYDGFESLLTRIRSASGPVYYPVFDRALDKAIAGAGVVHAHDEIVLVEGNYLLLTEPPWKNLRPLFDFTITIAAPLETLKTRLIQRWLDNDHSETDAEARAMSNDIPNAKRVIDNALAADLTVP